AQERLERYELDPVFANERRVRRRLGGEEPHVEAPAAARDPLADPAEPDDADRRPPDPGAELRAPHPLRDQSVVSSKPALARAQEREGVVGDRLVVAAGGDADGDPAPGRGVQIDRVVA